MNMTIINRISWKRSSDIKAKKELKRALCFDVMYCDDKTQKETTCKTTRRKDCINVVTVANVDDDICRSIVLMISFENTIRSTVNQTRSRCKIINTSIECSVSLIYSLHLYKFTISISYSILLLNYQ